MSELELIEFAEDFYSLPKEAREIIKYLLQNHNHTLKTYPEFMKACGFNHFAYPSKTIKGKCADNSAQFRGRAKLLLSMGIINIEKVEKDKYFFALYKDWKSKLWEKSHKIIKVS